MKTLLTLFILFFSSSVVAEDISDFQIEGISIGDSLLEYMSKNEIINAEGYLYPDKIFTTKIININSMIYDEVAVEYKSKDKKYIIQGIQWLIYFSNNIEDCYIKQDEIQKDINLLFPKSEKLGIFHLFPRNFKF